MYGNISLIFIFSINRTNHTLVAIRSNIRVPGKRDSRIPEPQLSD